MLYQELELSELKSRYLTEKREFERYKGMELKLDMSRGKPGKDQLDLSNGLFSAISDPEDCIEAGIDLRNYGLLDGIPSCKALFAELLGVRPSEVFVGGNASLVLMYDTIAKAYTHGMLHSEKPWSKLDQVKFLCPAPGYDRHFAICKSFGMEMITVPMTPDGPDMDLVEEYVKDPAVKGIWCVPKYSNPEGVVYSDETIRRFAALKPAAPDFLLMWDNAYCVHEFDGPFVPFADILTLCREAGRPDMVFEFASTSKITLPGAGVAAFAASEENIRYMLSLLTIQTISYDKLNQLRHVRFLKNKENVLALMKRHAEVLKPKFDAVLTCLEREIAPLGIATWTKPKGGYFISLNTMPGCAKRTVALMKEAGVVMTGAGATYPNGIDPEDRNIRIAPTYPDIEQLRQAVEVFCVCLKLAALEKLQG